MALQEIPLARIRRLNNLIFNLLRSSSSNLCCKQAVAVKWRRRHRFNKNIVILSNTHPILNLEVSETYIINLSIHLSNLINIQELMDKVQTLTEIQNPILLQSVGEMLTEKAWIQTDMRMVIVHHLI